MNEATFAILLDVSLFGFLALALALVAFGLVRKSNPLATWGSHGNVWTGPFNVIDVAVVVSFLLFYIMLMMYGKALEIKNVEKSEVSTMAKLATLIVVTLFFWGAVLFYLGIIHRINLAELFGLRRLRLPAVIGFGAVWFIVAFSITLLVSYLFDMWFLDGVWPDRDEQEAVSMFREAGGIPEKIMMIFAITILAPVTEETIYRGFIYPVIKKYTDRFFSVFFTSLMFALVHGNVPALAGLIVLAVMFTIAYEITGCLWVPILMHAIFNTVQLILLTYVDTA
jgi:membrane protease YdiL (CAAX protease family)